jgi:hypothetical protein
MRSFKEIQMIVVSSLYNLASTNLYNLTTTRPTRTHFIRQLLRICKVALSRNKIQVVEAFKQLQFLF